MKNVVKLVFSSSYFQTLVTSGKQVFYFFLKHSSKGSLNRPCLLLAWLTALSEHLLCVWPDATFCSKCSLFLSVLSFAWSVFMSSFSGKVFCQHRFLSGIFILFVTASFLLTPVRPPSSCPPATRLLPRATRASVSPRRAASVTPFMFDWVIVFTFVAAFSSLLSNSLSIIHFYKTSHWAYHN